MSSKFQVQRICQLCGKEFTARTTVTRYCGDNCSKKAYKLRIKEAKIEVSNKETQTIKNKPIEELKAKEFLTVRDVAQLLNCSIRTAYYYIDSGTIKAVNLGQRITRVKRSDIDKLFEQPQPEKPHNLEIKLYISECYSNIQIREKYCISESALRNIIIKHKIAKIKKGWFAYVPKTEIDKLLS